MSILISVDKSKKIESLSENSSWNSKWCHVLNRNWNEIFTVTAQSPLKTYCLCDIPDITEFQKNKQNDPVHSAHFIIFVWFVSFVSQRKKWNETFSYSLNASDFINERSYTRRNIIDKHISWIKLSFIK